MTTLRAGVASYEEMKSRTMRIARGEQHVSAQEPRVWFTSTESFAKVLSAGNRDLLHVIAEKAPASLDDDPALTLSAQRAGIASQANCATAADPTAAGVLDRDGCTAMLRATYVDETGSYVVTVGAAVLPGAARAAAAARAIAAHGDSAGLGPTVHTVQFNGTLAASFSNGRRQMSGVLSAGSYVVLYTVGYADSRPREPVAGDTYADAEMTTLATGVAQVVLAKVGAPLPVPHCPGTPGC